MIWLIWTPLLSLAWQATTLIIQYTVQLILLLTLVFALAYRLGWCHLWLWSLVEEVATQALNGTPVTVGSFSLDVLRGIWVFNNVMIHAPRRHLFQWESPVLCRLGRVRLEFNPVACLFGKYVLGDEQPPLDVTLLHMSDIQVFLERKSQVFNVYLLDPLYILPPSLEGNMNTATNNKNEDHPSGNASLRANDVENAEQETPFLDIREPDLQMSHSSFGAEPEDNNYLTSEFPEHAAEEDRAQIVVGEMFKAVQSLGRAVQEGQLPQALQEQRQRITKGLKDFNVNKQAMTANLNLVQQVSKMVVEKSQQAVSQSHLILQPKRQPPPSGARAPPLLARFGRVILDDLRIFTRTTIAVEQPETTATQKAAEEEVEQFALRDPSTYEGEGVEVTTETAISSKTIPQSASTSAAATSATTNTTTSDKKLKKTIVHKSFWNKPITVERVAVRASEFGAPLSAKDDQGFPILFQPLDKAIDAIFKRVVGDLAKNNTGRSRLMRTAMGEVLDFFMEKEYSEEKH